MNYKIFVLLFAFIAASQAFIVINTYSGTSCNETEIVARLISTTSCPQARSAMQLPPCGSFNDVVFGADYSYCSAAEAPIPEGWQFIKYGTEKTCNFTSEFSVIAAPQPLNNAVVIVYNDASGNTNDANVTLSCNNSSGVLTAESCVLVEGPSTYFCFKFSLENSVCASDNNSTTFAYSSSCVLPPVAQPIDEPVAIPVGAPIKAPLRTPKPTSEATSQKLIGSAAAFLSLVILI